MKAMLAAALVSLLSFASPAWAYSDYPARPVRVVVGASPGDPNDILARVVSYRLSEFFKQSFIVDNHAGANGNLAALRVAKAPNDGYTLLVVSAPFAAGVSIYPRLGYDPRRSFTPVARIASYREVLIVNASLGRKSLADFIALMRATPGRVTIASSGTGTTSHLAAELLKIRAGWLDALHVPYRSSGFALAGLLGEHVDAMVATVSLVRGHIATGRLRALAVTSATRADLLPGVPTIAELGYPGVEASAWTGIVAPAGTPYEAVVRLNVAISEITRRPETRRRFRSQGADAVQESPEDFAKFLHHEVEKWRKVVKGAGINVD
jgi:tripartite-type tricarboxylate transporter receptor subunit TctC